MMGFLHRSILEHFSGIWDTKVKLKIYSLFWCWIFWWWWDFFHHFYVRIAVYFSVCQTFRLGRRHVEYFLSPRGSCMKVDQFKKLRFEQLLLNIRPREKTVESFIFVGKNIPQLFAVLSSVLCFEFTF